MIKCNGSTGLAPATYLKKITEDDRVSNKGELVMVCTDARVMIRTEI